ncbi:MAG: DEAD/DEAH box helicase [Myxococcaceae bacterium]|nr:DEAD/DEAH box helicase [Myxococcaceae bacterium]
MQPQLPLDFSAYASLPVPESLAAFHPVVRAWFLEEVGQPSEPQVRAWPLIREGRSALVAAPTGSGKTLAAFLGCLDELFRLAAQGELTPETRFLYVSPLKALGNDVQKNLLAPLERLRERAKVAGVDLPSVRVMVRTGDTPAGERASMVKTPPHILITTPESLYLYLTSAKSRATLKTVRTVVVDEIHALVRDKRGAHLALSLERLEALTGRPLQRIGLSATQKPLQAIAHFLTGTGRTCEVVHVGHVRPWQLDVETPEDELSAVATHEMWGQIYDRLVALSREHRTMLVFTNTRKLAERVAHDLGERLGGDQVRAHHGSMSRELRLSAEDRLKAGDLKVMVATASLELGLDIGSIDLVVQLGSPRSIAVMLQRLGRAGHRLSATSKGLLIALTRDELIECLALKYAIVEGELDAVRWPKEPLDVLAQQLVAEVAAQEWSEAELLALVRRAAPYAELTEASFKQVLELMAEGVATSRGRSRVHLHHDRVNGLLRPRKGARLMAVQNGGAIPDTFQYPVIAEPEEKTVGSVDEDWAVESSPGDVFLLGTTSWRVQRVYDGTLRVVNAQGAPPSVPFWNGEAPARTIELSAFVARLREELASRKDAREWLATHLQISAHVADFAVRYLDAGKAALGAVPTQRTLVAERFFDDAGGMQLIIHAPFGGRINRAWGLALRKSFCRSFDFELQAAATDDGILLSLGEQHSFPLEDIFQFCAPATVEHVLTQAVLQAPLFGTRFRWTAGRALALSRSNGGKRVPPPIQRARAEDLLAAVFPAQVGCQDNHGGADIEPPDHPLVTESLKDCLREFLDVEGLKQVLSDLKGGKLELVARDVPEPSVFAHALLNSAPYTYLDDAPLEERRARAVSVRRTLPEAEAVQFGTLDGDAIARTVDEARRELREPDEPLDALLQLGLLPLAHQADRDGWAGTGLFSLDQGPWLRGLLESGRAGVLTRDGKRWAYAAERVPWIAALHGDQGLLPPLAGDVPVPPEEAAVRVVRGWLEVCGPTTVGELAAHLGLTPGAVEQALAAIELRGQVLRGRFRPGFPVEASQEWCDRRLLQRIHRLTVGRLRAEIEPLSPQDFMRFLFRWQRLSADRRVRGKEGLLAAVKLLEGWEAPAASWELHLFPARMLQYLPEQLEMLAHSGEVAWGRLSVRPPRPATGPRRGAEVTEPIAPPPRRAVMGRNANLSFVKRGDLDWLLCASRPEAGLDDGPAPWPEGLSAGAREVAQALERRGASFFQELVTATRRLPADVEDALWELLAAGVVTADAVQNLRVLQSPKLRRRQRASARGGPGRWSLLRPVERVAADEQLERVAHLLLDRYGVVFRDLAMREMVAPPWRELVQVYRRLEARGEVRGGRFLNGFAGEQYARPDAVELARGTRRLPKTGEVIRVAAVDPLNLTGVVTPGPRVPAVVGHVVEYVDGVPSAGAPKVVEVDDGDEAAEA